MSAKRRNKKQVSKFKWHRKRASFFRKTISILRRVAPKLAAGLVALIGLWAVIRPVLHVDPFREFDPATPFSERFKVSNDGNFGVYKLQFICVVDSVVVRGLKDVKYFNNFIDAVPYLVDEIPASGNTTIYCPLDRAIYTPGGVNYDQATMTFEIRFRDILHPWGTKTCFRFVGLLDSENKMQWTYENGKCAPAK